MKTIVLHTDSACENIKIVFSADITEHIKEYDTENLCKYLNIHIEFSNNIVSISSNNARRMAECFLFLLCDFIDLNAISTDMYCSESLLLTIDSLLQNSVEYHPDEIKLFMNDIDLSQALFHCGFSQNDGKIEIAPYRPEVTILSNVLSDLTDASITWPYPLSKKDPQPSYFSQFSYVQRKLCSMNFTYYGVIVVNDINNINDIEQQIIMAAQARRHIKFPHFMYVR